MTLWIVISFISAFFIFLPPDAKKKVMIGKSVFFCSEARSLFSRALGLMLRKRIADGTGLLFRFSHPMKPSFTSAGMRFSIDIIWFRKGRVSEITEDVSIASGKAVVVPKEEVDGCIEVASGTVRRNNIGLRDTISIY